MPRVFSLASWNVEHFNGKRRRTDRVVDFLMDKGLQEFDASHSLAAWLRDFARTEKRGVAEMLE